MIWSEYKKTTKRTSGLVLIQMKLSFYCISPKFSDTITPYHFNPLQTEQTLPHYILEVSNFNFRYAWLGDLHIPREKWLNYLQTMETDQMSHSAASDLGLHCLPVTILRVSVKWVNPKLNQVLLNPDLPCLCKQCRCRSFGFCTVSFRM